MSDQNIALEGTPSDKLVGGDEENHAAGGDDLHYGSGIFLEETNPDDVQYGTRVDAPLVAGSALGDDWPVAFANQIQGNWQTFSNAEHLDKWTKMYKSRLFNTVAFVKDGENHYPSLYSWSGAKKDGTDGNWVFIGYLGGIAITDLNGALLRIDSTIVLGEGLSLEAAGDQGNGVVIKLDQQPSSGDSGKTSGSPITISQMWGERGSVADVTKVNALYPLEINQGTSGPGNKSTGIAVMSIKPGVYEASHGNSCLLKSSGITLVKGQKPKAIYMPQEVVPTGGFFHLNPVAKGVDVQDDTGGDTALTGGQLTEVLASVAFYDTAPDDCNIKVWVEYKDPSNPIDSNILRDANGHPVVFEKQFNAGNEIGTIILSGAFYAKATQPLKVVVETDLLANQQLAVDSNKTMVCINQFGQGWATSVARIEFMRRAGVEITPVIQTFTPNMRSLAKEIRGLTVPAALVSSGEDGDTLNQFGLRAITDVEAEIKDGAVTVRDHGAITDFYFDTITDNVETSMLRGQEAQCSVTLENPDDSFELEVYGWTGTPDRVGYVYKTRTSRAIDVVKGWIPIANLTIAQDAGGIPATHSLTFTVPDEANNIVVIVRPSLDQQQNTMILSGFTFGTTKEVQVYTEVERNMPHEEHLRYSDSYSEYVLPVSGLAEIRYSLSNDVDGNPMPVGKLGKGKGPVVIDHTVNPVAGSGVPQFDGAMKFTADGEASIGKTYRAINDSKEDSTVTFWDLLFDVDGNASKIPESEKTFTIKAGTHYPGKLCTIPAYAVDVEKGQRVGGRAKVAKDGGAYVATRTEKDNLVQTTLHFEKLTP